MSGRPRSLGYMLNLVIECSQEDQKHPDLEGIRMAFVSSKQKRSGDLERSSHTTWRYRGVIELYSDMSKVIFVVQSKDGDYIGCVPLTKEEVEQYVGAASSTGIQDVERKFIMRAGSPALLLKFAIYNLAFGLLEEYMLSMLDQMETMMHRHEQDGRLSEVCHALEMSQQEIFQMLGGLFLSRFEKTGNLDDISKAAQYLHRAVELTPEGHADMSSRLEELGISFARHFERTGNIDDISKAIEHLQHVVTLTPKGHPRMPSRFNNLGTTMRKRFEQAGNLDDISKAIEYHYRAIALTPEGHSDMPTWLNSLGDSFRSRFERTGILDDISKAIENQLRAVDLIPENHINMPKWLSNLGISFHCRFEKMGNLDDISRAIEYQDRSVALTPEGDADMPSLLDSLGNSYQSRFVRTGKLEDISKAIEHQLREVALTPKGHAHMPLWLNNLGISFRSRFDRMANPDDISKAIEALQQAVALTPQGSASLPLSLHNLGDSFESRFKLTGQLEDLSKAIEYKHRAVALTPEGHTDMPRRREGLVRSLFHRFEKTLILADCEAANLNSRLAATQLSGSPNVRLNAARCWAVSSMGLDDPKQTLQAYTVAVELLSLVAGLNQKIQNRHDNLATHSDLISEAVLVALLTDRTSTALEWLEQGRCLVWAQLNQLRTPVEILRDHDAHLADHFLKVAKVLELLGSRPDESSTGEMAIKHHMKIEEQVRTHLTLAQEWEQILAQIRALPDFHDFLQPRKVTTILSQLPPEGPVVIINAHPLRCDALALVYGADEVLRIPLNDMTYKKLEKLRRDLRHYLTSKELLVRDGRAGGPSLRRNAANIDVLRNILHVLWKGVVQPILAGLGYCSTSPRRNRIWWCPTGPLTFLPIHAAGIYSSADKTPGSRLSDYAISSYIPTVNTLLEKLMHSVTAHSQSDTKILLVSQPNTPGQLPIPGTTTETQVILDKTSENGLSSIRLEGSEATMQRVEEGLKSHQWVHFACHASQHPTEPLKSGFYLYDGQLELMGLIRQDLPTAEFAFLSACQTSVGDEKLSDEAVHLAAGMLAAGYQGVVGTMWSIKDWYAPKVAKKFYGRLLEERRDSGSHRLKCNRAAYTLDQAIQKIRDELPNDEHSLLTWVPYVHYGL